MIRNSGRITILILVLVMLFTFSSVSLADNIININLNISGIIKDIKAVISEVLSMFEDIKQSDWFVETVSKLVKLGGIDGYGDGTFKPNKEISKAEFTKILLGTLGYDEGNTTNGHWASKYIEKAEGLKIIDKSEFKSSEYDESITRNEMAKMIARTLELKGEVKTQDLKDYISLINDYYSIPSKYRDYVLEVYSKGIITGYDIDNTFRGDRGLTRAEASTVIIRVIDENDRKIPTRPEKNPVADPVIEEDWIEPELQVYYTTDDKDAYEYFKIQVTNYKDYDRQGKVKDYKFTTELLDHKELEVIENYNYLVQDWIKVNTMERYKDVTVLFLPGGTIYSLEDLRRGRYVDTKEKINLKEGEVLSHKVTVTKGDITKEYIMNAEFRNKNFRY